MNLIDITEKYQSPEITPSWLGRRKPGWVFYPKLVSIVWRAARLAKKGKFDPEAWVASSFETFKAFESLGTKIIIENGAAFQNLDSPCVFIGNHMSTLETFLLPCIIQPYRDVLYIVKKNLADFPVFKHIIIARKPIVVGRVNPKEDFQTVIREGVDRLKRNISIIVFPQTTRSLRIDPKSFNSIGIKLAKHAGVPVIPVALKTNAWGIGKKIKEFGEIQPENDIHFAFGDPIPVTGNGREAHQATLKFITEKLRIWFS